jgi:hypothetical protein
MSMAEPFLPSTPDSDNAPAAAEPGPGGYRARPARVRRELPGAAAEASEESEESEASEESTETSEVSATEQDDVPFRTPVAGERLTADELEDRI